MGVGEFRHLGLLLDVPLEVLLHVVAHVELGGIFHLLADQLLLGLDLFLLPTCVVSVNFLGNSTLGYSPTTSFSCSTEASR